MKYDVVIVGAGPSSMFLAYELKELGSKKNILIIEQGHPVEHRVCVNAKYGSCDMCKQDTCANITGVSGAGAHSDGKLSMYNREDKDIHVGGELHNYIGTEETKKLMDYVASVHIKFGADPKLEGVEYPDEVARIKAKAKTAGIDLINIPILHLGTERAHDVYYNLQNHLLEHGVEIRCQTIVSDLIIKNNEVKGVRVKSTSNINKDVDLESIYADKVVLAVGRKGSHWLSNLCNQYGIKTKSGVVDIGIRYELPNSVMKDINKYMYEAKFIARIGTYKDKVRTFCQNPGGYVTSEVYDDNITLANGHSYKEDKSDNTNLAILVSHKFSYPFNQPIEYGRNVAKNLNALGNGNIVVQRLGDIQEGKRTWNNELEHNIVKPTLRSAVAGDITYALGYRTMTGIMEFIEALDKVIEGFANPENLLYGPEIKFYSNQVKIDERFETSVNNLYSIGDGGGMTRGLMMASCSGVQLARYFEE